MATSDEQVRRPLLKTYYENCPGCKIDEVKERREGYPVKELIILGLLVLSNVLPISCLFSFIYFMVKDFNIGTTADIGYYAGCIGSSFMFGRFLTSALWGLAADKYGRKPVMIIGVSSVVVFNTLFGMSTNFWMALSMRFLLGSFNGLLGPVKAYASEICRDNQQAMGLSVVSTMWGLGLIIGPVIGGFLAQPADQFPKIFSQTSLFGRFPFLLPCLCISSIALVVLIITFWLPETIHKHPLEGEEKGDHDKEVGVEDNPIQEERGGSMGSQKVHRKSLLRNWPIMSSIIIYCFYSLHSIAYVEIFPLWAESPKVDGGLGFTTDDVGIVLSISGTGLLIFQLLFFPPLANYVGAILIIRIAAVISIPLLASYPFIAKLSGVLLWLVLNLASLLKNVLAGTMLTGTFLLLNNCVSRDRRGEANGIAMTAMSLFKTIGPAGAGAVFSWGQERQTASFLPGNEMVFFILNIILVIVVAMTFGCFLPQSTDRLNIEGQKNSNIDENEPNIEQEEDLSS